MATEKQAKQARAQYSGYLSELGAHALSVDHYSKDGTEGFAVVVFVEGDEDKIPNELEIQLRGKTTFVPVVTEKVEKFKPQ